MNNAKALVLMPNGQPKEATTLCEDRVKEFGFTHASLVELGSPRSRAASTRTALERRHQLGCRLCANWQGGGTPSRSATWMGARWSLSLQARLSPWDQEAPPGKAPGVLLRAGVREAEHQAAQGAEQRQAQQGRPAHNAAPSRAHQTLQALLARVRARQAWGNLLARAGRTWANRGTERF